jgi:hypothetical protein
MMLMQGTHEPAADNAGGFPACRPPAGEAGQAGGGWHSPNLQMMEVSKEKNK